MQHRTIRIFVLQVQWPGSDVLIEMAASPRAAPSRLSSPCATQFPRLIIQNFNLAYDFWVFEFKFVLNFKFFLSNTAKVILQCKSQSSGTMCPLNGAPRLRFVTYFSSLGFLVTYFRPPAHETMPHPPLSSLLCVHDASQPRLDSFFTLRCNWICCNNPPPWIPSLLSWINTQHIDCVRCACGSASYI